MIFSSLAPAMVLFYEILKEKFIHKLELFGASLAIGGVCLLALNPKLPSTLTISSLLIGLIHSFSITSFLKLQESIGIRLPSTLMIALITLAS